VLESHAVDSWGLSRTVRVLAGLLRPGKGSDGSDFTFVLAQSGGEVLGREEAVALREMEMRLQLANAAIVERLVTLALELKLSTVDVCISASKRASVKL